LGRGKRAPPPPPPPPRERGNVAIVKRNVVTEKGECGDGKGGEKLEN